MIQIGFLRGRSARRRPDGDPARGAGRERTAPALAADDQQVANLFAQATSVPLGTVPQRLPGARTCPKRQAPTLIRQEGCDSCSSCGYSKCG